MGGRPEREQKGRQGPDCTEPTQSWWELGFYSGWNEKLLNDFKQSDMILFILKILLVVTWKMVCAG